MNLAAVCRESINQELDQNLKQQLKQFILDNTLVRTWEEAYWSAKCISEHFNQDFEHDQLIMQRLDTAADLGLTYEKDANLFFDASLMRAQLKFKYKHYQDASNDLLHLRELEFEGPLPNWVFQYSAVTLYKLNMGVLLRRPELFFEYVDKINPDQTQVEYEHQLSVIRDFLVNVRDYLEENRAPQDETFNVINRLEPFIEDYIDDLGSEWYDLASCCMDEFTRSNLSPLVKQLAQISEFVSRQQIRISELESEVESLKNQLTNKDDAVAESHVNVQPVPTKSRKHKILVFGASQVPNNKLLGIAKKLGLEKDQLVLMTDYEQNKRFNFKEIQYRSPYSGILLGPVAHKVVALGDHSSLLTMLQQEQGYPHVEAIRTHTGELKITKTSFRDALQRLLLHLDSLDVDKTA